MLLSNSRNLNPMGAFFFRFALELWRHYMHYQVYWCWHSFTKNPPTVPPSPPPKLTKREDSAAVLLIFQIRLLHQNTNACRQEDMTNIACSQYMYVWSLMIQKTINWEIVRQWLVLRYFNLFPIMIGQLSSKHSDFEYRYYRSITYIILELVPIRKFLSTLWRKKNGVKYLRAYWGSRSCWSLYFGYMENYSFRRCRWSTGLPKLWNWRSAFSSCLIHFTQCSCCGRIFPLYNNCVYNAKMNLNR